MNHSSEHRPDFLRDKLIGLGENSIRKNYYPELQKRLAELENFRNLLDKVSDGILMAKVPSGTIVDANEAACVYLGIETNHIDAAPLTDFFPSTRSLLQGVGNGTGLSGKRQEFFVEFRRGDGSRVPLDVSVDVVALGAQLFAVVLLRDISERQRADAMLRHVSTHDPLTGLYNRAYLEYEFQRRRDFLPVPCLLISCDIDGLKMTNETLGPAAGDQRLIVAGILMSELVVTGDIAARVGGDEFALFRPGAGRDQAEQLCRQLRDSVVAYNESNKDLFLSLSVGYSVAVEHPLELNAMFRDADNLVRREKLLRSQSTRSGIVQTMMTLLEARDFITEGHAERLESLVSGLAEWIGFSPNRLGDMKLFAKFHDIGKVGISDRILFKPGALDAAEREEMCRHSEIGYRIALSSGDLVHIAEWILRHHEWWDGGGYPIGLAGEAIPMECRILSIADAFDAMTSDRPYRKAMSASVAMQELRRFAGRQFDPSLLDPFEQLLKHQGML